jgi:Holliday junction resolvase RusA-like endonuclease
VKVSFTILGQPASKANSRRFVKFGERMASVKSKEALTYEKDALRQIPRSARQRLEGPVKVTLRIFYATERPDLDESIVLDVLQDRYKKVEGTTRLLIQDGVYRNDRQVREKHVFHGIDRANPRTEIEIETMVEQQAALELKPKNELATAAAPF